MEFASFKLAEYLDGYVDANVFMVLKTCVFVKFGILHNFDLFNILTILKTS